MHAKADEVTAIIANLCSNFELIVQRLRAASKKQRTLDEQIEAFENREIAEQKEHDRQMDALSKELESRRRAREQRWPGQAGRPGPGREQELQAEAEELRRQVRELEAAGALRQSSLRQKRQKLSEEDKSLQALIQARDKLEREAQAEEGRVEALEGALGPAGGRRQGLSFEQTREAVSLREGKAELQQLQTEERRLAARVKAVERQLRLDAKQLEGKRARLETLRQLQKALARRAEEKRRARERYLEVHEHSLSLQYLCSEALRELARRFELREADVPESPLAQESAEQVLQRQLAHIDQLRGAVRQRTVQIYKKQYGDALGPGRPSTINS